MAAGLEHTFTDLELTPDANNQALATNYLTPDYFSEYSVEELQKKISSYKGHLTRDKTKTRTQQLDALAQDDQVDTPELRLCMKYHYKTRKCFDILDLLYQTIISKLTEDTDEEGKVKNPPLVVKMETDYATLMSDHDEYETSIQKLILAKKSTAILQRQVEEEKRKQDAQKEREKERKEQEEKDDQRIVLSRNREQLKKAVKVQVLTKDFSMPQYAAWKEQFKCYYTLNAMAELEDDMARQIFVSHLSPELQTEIRQRVQATTPVYDDGSLNAEEGERSAMEHLDEIFNLHYPIFRLRVKLLEIKRKQGETFSHFIARMEDAGDHADLDSISKEDLLALLIHANCEHQEAKEKWYKKPDITLDYLKASGENFDRGIRNAETTTASVNNVNDPGSTTAQVEAASMTLGNRHTFQADNRSQQRVNEPRFTCFACGGNHTIVNCSARNLYCRQCHRGNHTQAVCHLQHLRTSGNNRRGGRGRGRGSTRPSGRPAPRNAQVRYAETTNDRDLSYADMAAANVAAANATNMQPLAGPAVTTAVRGSVPTPRLQL